MAGAQLFPIYGRFVGDFVPHLVGALTTDTMPELAEKIAVHSVGRRLPARPGGRYEVLLDGKVVPDQVTLGELVAERRLPPLSWFDVRWRD
jgi:Toluene-4-monooxygenase system protein B (TmoB)